MVLVVLYGLFGFIIGVVACYIKPPEVSHDFVLVGALALGYPVWLPMLAVGWLCFGVCLYGIDPLIKQIRREDKHDQNVD